jgi:hypothetical protein
MPLRIVLQTKMEGCPPWQPIFAGGARLCQTNSVVLAHGEKRRRRSVALQMKLEGCPLWQPIFAGGARLCQTN